MLKASLLWKVYMAAVTDSGGLSDIWIHFSFSSCLNAAGTISPATGQAQSHLNHLNIFKHIWTWCIHVCSLRTHEVITLTCATGCSTDTMAEHSTACATEIQMPQVSQVSQVPVIQIGGAKEGRMGKGYLKLPMISYDPFWSLATGRCTSDTSDIIWHQGLSSCRPILPSAATARWRMEILQPMELAAQISPDQPRSAQAVWL